jgi:hypothetical protein
MSKEKEIDETDSHRVEIEIATVLLGFLFVIDSIILTMPSDVLTIIKQSGFKYFFSITWLGSPYMLSVAGLYGSFSLLGAIPCYFLFLKFRRKWSLLIARSLLAVSLLLTVILVINLNVFLMARLVESQANEFMNPISGLVLFVSFVATISYIALSWIMWLLPIIRSWQEKRSA